jgi:hypothetical protein
MSRAAASSAPATSWNAPHSAVCARKLSSSQEPQAQLEADLGRALLQRPHAAADSGDEALTLQLLQVAAHGDLRDANASERCAT